VERNRLQQAKGRLRELAELHEAAMDNTDWLEKSGAPAESILRTAVQKRADLIVLGVRAGQGLSDRLMWPNACRVVCDSHCPVLSVRTH
jgi:nucleotide-binding universal stress UspA family protein